MRELMRRAICSVGVIAIVVVAACGPRAGTLDGAAAALGPASLNSIEFSGSGRWFQFGQAPSPTLPWPQYEVSAYNASINFQTPSARVRMTRIQTVEPGRVRPTPATQSPEQLVSGALAWNMAVPARIRAALVAREINSDDVLAACPKPVLVSHGREDRVILPAMGEHILSMCSGAQASWYPETGHAPFLEDPARFNKELSRFVREA